MRTPPLLPLRTGSAAGLALAMVLLLTGVSAGSGPMLAGGAWIDQPLTGSTYPLGEVPVTVHATDPSGVAEIHLWVGDAILDSVEDDTTPILATATFAWTADQPGSYLLTVRGVGKSGEWGQPASAIVTIGEDVDQSPNPSASASPDATPAVSPAATAAATPRATPAQTPTSPPSAHPTPTLTPSPTPLPTPVPCVPTPPLLLAPPAGTVITDGALNPPTFKWAYRTPPACTPTGYRLQAYDDPDLAHIVLTVNLGPVSQWTPSAPLANCTTYYWRVAARGTAYGPWSDPSGFTVSARC
jgi:hypothetical protein